MEEKLPERGGNGVQEAEKAGIAFLWSIHTDEGVAFQVLPGPERKACPGADGLDVDHRIGIFEGDEAGVPGLEERFQENRIEVPFFFGTG